MYLQLIFISMLALAELSQIESALNTLIISKEIKDFENISKLDADAFVKNSAEELKVIYNKFKELPESVIIPVTYENNDIYTANSKLIAELEASEHVLFNISTTARSFDLTAIKNEELKYTVEKFKNIGSVFRLGGDGVIKLAKYMNTLKEVYTAKAVQCFQNRNDFNALCHCDNLVFGPGNNLADITHYWRTKNEYVTKTMSEPFFDTVTMIQYAARRYNISAAKFWYPNYSAEAMSEMADIMQMLKPFYQQLHAYIRHKLFKMHGADIIKQNGHILQPLYEQVKHQLQLENVADDYFKEDFPISELPDYNNLLKAHNFVGEKSLKAAENFYYSIGFENLTNQFWEYNIYKIGNTEICAAEHILPNITSEHCNCVPEFQKFSQHHVALGRIHAAYLKKDLPAHFDDGHFLGETVGNTVKLAATTPKHLKAMGLLNNFQFTKELMLNRNFHNALEVMFSLTYSYIGAKVLTEFLNGNVKNLELNDYYWQLMAEYAGVEPPLVRNKQNLELPYYIYEDLLHNTNVIHKFTEHIWSYQFYSAICKKIGYTDLLDNCDFSNNLGTTLSEMLSSSSRKQFKEIVRPLLLNDSKPNSKSLLDYFKPTQQWLTIYLESQQITTGWERTDH